VLDRPARARVAHRGPAAAGTPGECELRCRLAFAQKSQQASGLFSAPSRRRLESLVPKTVAIPGPRSRRSPRNHTVCTPHDPTHLDRRGNRRV